MYSLRLFFARIKYVLFFIPPLLFIVSVFLFMFFGTEVWPWSSTLGKGIVLRGFTKQADAYIISLSGKDYFLKNYKVNIEKSFSKRDAIAIVYDYLPLQADVSVYFYGSGDLFSRYKLIKEQSFVGCVRDGRISEPIASRDDVLILADKVSDPNFHLMRISADDMFYFFDGKNWIWQLSKEIVSRGSIIDLMVDICSGKVLYAGTHAQIPY